MIEYWNARFTGLQNVLKQLHFKLESEPAISALYSSQKPSCMIGEDTATERASSSSSATQQTTLSFSGFPATSSSSIQPPPVAQTLKTDCQRCAVKISALLFEFRTLRGSEYLLARSQKRVEAQNLLQKADALKETLDAIALEYEADCHRDNLLTQVTEALEKFHNDFATSVYSIIE